MSDDDTDEHIENVDPGCGCAELWEHLSAARERNRDRAGE